MLVLAPVAMRPPLEEAARVFQERTGTAVELRFGSSGKILSEIELARRGDIFVAVCPEYMEEAMKRTLLIPGSERVLAYLVPHLVTPADNPKGVRTLEDLTRPGIRVALPDPRAACAGRYAREVLERAGLWNRVLPNLVAYTEDWEKLAQALALHAADAGIGWGRNQFSRPEEIQDIPIPPEHLPRVSYVAAALLRSSSPAARAFLDFLAGEGGKSLLARKGYITTRDELSRYVLPGTPVGGSWSPPPPGLGRVP